MCILFAGHLTDSGFLSTSSRRAVHYRWSQPVILTNPTTDHPHVCSWTLQILLGTAPRVFAALSAGKQGTLHRSTTGGGGGIHQHSPEPTLPPSLLRERVRMTLSLLFHSSGPSDLRGCVTFLHKFGPETASTVFGNAGCQKARLSLVRPWPFLS